MEENRMCLPRVRSPQEDHVRVLCFLEGAGAAARAEHCRQTDDAGRVSGPVAAIDVVTADDHAGKLLGDEVHLVGGLGATEQAERPRTVTLDNRLQAGGGAVERLVPARPAKVALLANQRLGQTRVTAVAGWGFHKPRSLW